MAENRIKSYELDKFGVVVDDNGVGSDPGKLTKAQNAITDPIGEKGSVRKRPGLKRLNATAGSGVIRGGFGVPMSLGSAGAIVRNPFGDLSTTIAQYTARYFDTRTQRLGATFDDESQWFDFDWNFDFSELEEVLATLAGLASDDDALDVSGQGGILANDASEMVPITLFGDTTGLWIVTLDAAVTEKASSSTTYPDTRTLVFPTGKFRAGMTGFSVAAGAGTAALSGKPSCVLNNRVYYADGNYVVGTNPPPIRMFDGYVDRIVCRVPKSPDVSTTTPITRINHLLAANGKIYVSTQDGGTVSANSGIGSVWQFDPTTNAIVKLGATFAIDQIPYSLAWHQGRLWVGTASNNASAKVFWIRPGIDTAFTTDLTLGAGEAAVSSMVVFQGELYAGVLNRTVTAGNVKLKKRTNLGVWSDVDTGTLDTNAAHIAWRGYHDVVVWPPEDSGITSPTPTLYACRQGATEDTWPNLVTRRLSGTWSTVNATAGGFRLLGTYVIIAGVATPVLWDLAGTTLFESTNGTSWTDRSAQVSALGGTSFILSPLFVQA